MAFLITQEDWSVKGAACTTYSPIPLTGPNAPTQASVHQSPKASTVANGFSLWSF